MGVAASQAWLTKPEGNLTDANEEGDEDMRRSFMAQLAPKRKQLAICLEQIPIDAAKTHASIHNAHAQGCG
jgi:hypothetical protein